MKQIYIVVMAVLIIGSIVIYRKCSNREIIPARKEAKELNLSSGAKIYSLAKVWGVSGNHEEIIFSENKISVANKEKDYIFYTDEVFYEIKNDTLVIYAPQSSKSLPLGKFKKITVVIKDLKNSEEIRNFSTNFQKYGLRRISVYDK